MLLNFASAIAGLGKLQQLEFKGAGANGADRFGATFEHGAAKAQILLAEDGRIELVLLASPEFF